MRECGTYAILPVEFMSRPGVKAKGKGEPDTKIEEARMLGFLWREFERRGKVHR